jgi:serpin B
VALALILSGCATTPTPTAPATGAASSAVPSVSPAATPALPPTSAPTAAPKPGAFAPGSLAVTVSDDLVVRSKPEVSDASKIYRPYLPTGTELRVIEGPVAGSGYRWYHVDLVGLTLAGGVTSGWVAAASRDGVRWIGSTGVELAMSTVARAPAKPAEARKAAAAVNAFGLDLYKRLDKKAGNAVISPTSIAIALAMARAGARGETAAQMDAVLHTAGWDVLESGLNALTQELAGHDATWKDSGGKPHSLALRIANAAFGQRGWPIEQVYLDSIASAFGAGLRLVDYVEDLAAARKTINAWVRRQTVERIPQLLGPSDLTPDTRLVLVNAVYLKAKWEIEFEPSDTTPRSFTRLDGSRVRVPTMWLPAWNAGQIVPYATGDGWKATELRYLGAGGSTPLAMTLVLPDDLTNFERQLTTAKLQAVVSKLDKERRRLERVTYMAEPVDGDCGTYAYSVQLYMPRFSADTRAPLKEQLAALGMPSAFDPGTADFTGIATRSEGPLYIDDVIHQANIDVDEAGTEAAAATAVEMGAGGCTGPEPAKVVTLRLNRPYLFVLRDVPTGAILFIGRVTDPSK